MKLLIVVPAFNESKVIYKVLKSLPEKLNGISEIEIIVVNDGSSDKTARMAQGAGVTVINHAINRGLGAAIKTGMAFARRINADVMVTFDGDGQHDPKDIPKVVLPVLKKEAELVIGSRFAKNQKIPLDRLILNWFANFATFLLYGVSSTDSQSGLRAFSKRALNLIDFKADRMDFSSEILLEAKRNNLRIMEVPIRAIYTQYSRIKGQKNTNAFPVFVRLLVRLLR